MQDLSAVAWALRPVKKYAVFSGRAPRAEYWWFYLGTSIVSIPVKILENVLDVGALSVVYNLALLLPWLGVTVRRLHDTDRSGLWLLLFFLPFFAAGFIAAFVYGGQDGVDWDPFSSMGPLMIMAIVALIILAVLLFIFLVLPGTPGPNRYGPNPHDDGSNLEEVFA